MTIATKRRARRRAGLVRQAKTTLRAIGQEDDRASVRAMLDYWHVGWREPPPLATVLTAEGLPW